MTQLVGFFSYKGGVGRTAMLCNAALALLQQQKSKDGGNHGVFCVDLDVTAPGLPTFFGLHSQVTDFLQWIISGAVASRSLSTSAVQIELPPGGRKLPFYVLAQERPDRKGLTYLANVFAKRSDPEELLAGLRYLGERGQKDFLAPFTLLDLGAGLGELPNVVLKELDQLVLVGRGDRQHRSALPFFLKTIHGAYQKDRSIPLVHVVLNQLPTAWCAERSEQSREFIKDSSLGTFIDSKGDFAQDSTAQCQVRTLELVPLIEAALTQEVIFYPDDWTFSPEEEAGSFRLPVTDNEQTFRGATGRLSRHILAGGIS